jgi:hypothetical protein
LRNLACCLEAGFHFTPIAAVGEVARADITWTFSFREAGFYFR